MGIWSGFGFVTAGIFALCVVLALALGPVLGVEDNLRLASGLLGASVANWVVGRGFNDPARTRVRVDPGTGRLHVAGGRHALLRVPMQYWSFIGTALTLAVLIANAQAG